MCFKTAMDLPVNSWDNGDWDLLPSKCAGASDESPTDRRIAANVNEESRETGPLPRSTFVSLSEKIVFSSALCRSAESAMWNSRLLTAPFHRDVAVELIVVCSATVSWTFRASSSTWTRSLAPICFARSFAVPWISSVHAVLCADQN